jgi:L-ectoine synthase
VADAASNRRAAVIVRDLAQLEGTDRDVKGEGWRSRRLLRRDDGVKFSLHYTELEAGAELELEYANHYEANYCISGEGEVVDLARGKTHELGPGTMYTLDQHDRHILHTKTPMTLMCVFWPALAGSESHDSNGGYPLVEEGADTL